MWFSSNLMALNIIIHDGCQIYVFNPNFSEFQIHRCNYLVNIFTWISNRHLKHKCNAGLLIAWNFLIFPQPFPSLGIETPSFQLLRSHLRFLLPAPSAPRPLANPVVSILKRHWESDHLSLHLLLLCWPKTSSSLAYFIKTAFWLTLLFFS